MLVYQIHHSPVPAKLSTHRSPTIPCGFPPLTCSPWGHHLPLNTLPQTFSTCLGTHLSQILGSTSSDLTVHCWLTRWAYHLGVDNGLLYHSGLFYLPFYSIYQSIDYGILATFWTWWTLSKQWWCWRWRGGRGRWSPFTGPLQWCKCTDNGHE